MGFNSGFKGLNKWRTYGIMIMCDIICIGRFHKSVANCDRYPTYQSGRFHTGCTVSFIWVCL